MKNTKTNLDAQIQEAESRFSAFLVSEKIDTVITEKWKRLRWFIYTIAAILIFFGYDLWDKVKEMRVLKSEFQKELLSIRMERDSLNRQLDLRTSSLKRQLDEQGNQLENQSQEFLFQDKKLSDQQKEFDRTTNFSNLYHDIFADQLQQTKALRDEIRSGQDKYAVFTKVIDSSIRDYQNEYFKLTSLRNSLTGRIDSIERRTKENSINASLKYIYAERSDRLQETFTNPFKPSVYFLPGKRDTLTFVFYHATKTDRTGKIAHIDVYRNRKKLDRSPIEIEEKNGVLSPSLIPLQVGEDVYNIEPVFIYLPPNLGGVLLIPDFVVLKITMQA